jgi:hypothetical protein
MVHPFNNLSHSRCRFPTETEASVTDQNNVLYQEQAALKGQLVLKLSDYFLLKT